MRARDARQLAALGARAHQCEYIIYTPHVSPHMIREICHRLDLCSQRSSQSIQFRSTPHHSAPHHSHAHARAPSRLRATARDAYSTVHMRAFVPLTWTLIHTIRHPK